MSSRSVANFRDFNSNVFSLQFPCDNGRVIRGVDSVRPVNVVLCGVGPAGQVWLNNISNLTLKNTLDHDHLAHKVQRV